MSVSKTINWSEFSQKHKSYIKKCENSTFNFAEGAVRSGKTICNILAFAFALETSADKLHLATGVSLAAACLNIGDCNGFGLEHIFRGRCRWGKFRQNTCLFIKTSTSEKIVIFAGGGKADSYKKIRGNSYGLWIATEINKHYISKDDKCFISEAFNRQLAAKTRRIFWDFNPDYPSHPIYSEYVDKYRSLAIGVNYECFTLWDNLSITEQRKQQITAQYEKGSVWYRRCILGERVAAEGLIFRNFADNPERWKTAKPPDDIEFITVGGDYGGNLSSTVFVATAVRKKYKGICVLAEKKLSGAKGTYSPDIIEKEFISFIKDVETRFNMPVRYAFMDSEGQYLTNGIIRACKREGLSVSVTDSKKLRINDRIACKSRLLAQDRWQVLGCCKHVIESTATQSWDPDFPDRRLDDGTSDIDTCDAEEYSWERFALALNKE